MILNDHPTHYDLLEVPPDASPQELRAAYLRAKSAYKRDSVALYTLISQEETDELLDRIEEAYQVLSSPEKRRDYDRSHGLLDQTGEQSTPRALSRPPRNQKIISIDRVPPMEDSAESPELLVPPRTDFTTPSAPSSAPSASLGPAASRPPEPAPEALAPASFGEKSIAVEIEQEKDWHGPFLRKVREHRNVSLEELSEYTKIGKTYLIAIEEEQYDRLPATVFVRGFVTHVAKFLKLPHERVAAAYVSRIEEARLRKAQG